MEWLKHPITREFIQFLVYFIGAYVLSQIGYVLWSGHRMRHAERWMNWVETTGKKFAAWKSAIRKIKDKGLAHSAVIANLFAVTCLCLLLAGGYRMRSNLVTEHNIVIYRQLDNGDWQMSSDEDKSLVFRPCADDKLAGIDVDGILRQASVEANRGDGYIADYATWEELGTCKSILRPAWGFWFKDAHNNFTYRRTKP